MDTKTLLATAKARYAYNSSKEYLKQKYGPKLLVASQDGLWKADQQTISFLSVIPTDQVVMIDTFDRLVLVNRLELLETLTEVYTSVMTEWHNESLQLEGQR